MKTSSEIGEQGEQIAENYLRDNGYYIVEKNYKAGIGANCVGEIDIVAMSGTTLHIVEVKTRTNTATSGDFSPESAFTTSKVNRLRRAARQFIRENRFDGDLMFDLISINLSPDGRPLAVRHYVDLVH